MLFSFRYCKLAIMYCLAASIAFAQNGGNFYDGRKEGFYWYQDEHPIESEPYFEMPEPDAFAYADLWRMNPEKMAEVLDDRKLIAIQVPTEINALRYIEAQDVAKRKSMAFAGAMGLAIQRNPKFQNAHSVQMTDSTKKAHYQAKEVESESILNNGSNAYALMVFESPGCHYCEAQRPILDRFQVNYGWTIRYLDIDEYRPLAEQYGIDVTPSILMLSKEAQTAMPISTGVISTSDLRKRLMRAIRYLNGETKPEQWFSEQGVTDPLKFIDRKGRGGDD